MGLFGWIGSTVKAVASKAVDVVKSIFGFGDAAARELSKEDSYDKERATHEETARVHSQLSTYKNKATDMTSHFEYQLGNHTEKLFSSMRDHLGYMEAEFDKLKLGPIRQKLDSIIRRARKLDGVLEKEIIYKISLSDEECCEILYMPSGKDKMEAMRAFMRRNFRHAINKQRRNIRETVEGLEDEVEVSIRGTAKDIIRRVDEIIMMQKELLDNIDKEEEILAGAGGRICLARRAVDLFPRMKSGGMRARVKKA